MIDETERNVNTTCENHDITCATEMAGETEVNQNTTCKSHEIKCELEMSDNVETYNRHHL